MLGLAVTLAGCEDSQGPNFDFLKKKPENNPTISSETGSQDLKGVEREVEKPDVFSANEPALWDGRPSLGGVWVAAPGVKDPERVIIRNLENGKSVVGALFRRERENPGPRLQLSSDAAVELGVLAGAPTKLGVVALRTETVVPVAAPAAAPAPAPAETPTIIAAPAPDVDPIPIPIRRPETSTTNIETASAAQPSGPADPVVAQPEPEPVGSPSSMPNFLNRGARRSAQNASNSFDAAAGAGTSSASSATGTGIETAAVTTQTLDPIKAAEAALERADATIAQAPAATIAPASRQKPAPSEAPRSSSPLAKPYIQIGIFAVKANADRAARRLNDAGVLPVVLKQQSAGRTIWRVIVGPARSRSDGRALHSKVKGLGYADAYFVTD